MDEKELENIEEIEEVEVDVEETPEISEEISLKGLAIGLGTTLTVGACALVYTNRDKIENLLIKKLKKRGYIIYKRSTADDVVDEDKTESDEDSKN